MGCGASSPLPLQQTKASEAAHRPCEAEKAANARETHFLDVRDMDARYLKGTLLGKGSFAECYSAVDKVTGDMVAVKAMYKDNKRFRSRLLDAEVKIMFTIEHPQVVRLHHAYEDSHAAFLILELVPGGDLLQRLLKKGPMSEANTAHVSRQMLEAVGYLHGMGVCHRDLKPENILMVSDDVVSPDYWSVKITDFGLSCKRDNVLENVMHTLHGTPEFAAPEVLALSRDKTKSWYSCKVDIWSIGAIVYVMLTATSPFRANGNLPAMIDQIITGKFSCDGPEWKVVSATAVSFVKELMQVSPEVRPGAVQCLDLPFLANNMTPDPPVFGDRTRSTPPRMLTGLGDSMKSGLPHCDRSMSSPASKHPAIIYAHRTNVTRLNEHVDGYTNLTRNSSPMHGSINYASMARALSPYRGGSPRGTSPAARRGPSIDSQISSASTQVSSAGTSRGPGLPKLSVNSVNAPPWAGVQMNSGSNHVTSTPSLEGPMLAPSNALGLPPLPSTSTSATPQQHMSDAEPHSPPFRGIMQPSPLRGAVVDDTFMESAHSLSMDGVESSNDVALLGSLRSVDGVKMGPVSHHQIVSPLATKASNFSALTAGSDLFP